MKCREGVPMPAFTPYLCEYETPGYCDRRHYQNTNTGLPQQCIKIKLDTFLSGHHTEPWPAANAPATNECRSEADKFPVITITTEAKCISDYGRVPPQDPNFDCREEAIATTGCTPPEQLPEAELERCIEAYRRRLGCTYV